LGVFYRKDSSATLCPTLRRQNFPFEYVRILRLAALAQNDR